LERIEIERACERLVHAYSRALDLGEMSAAADFFAEHGSFARPMAPDKVIQGREAIRAALLTRPKTFADEASCHQRDDRRRQPRRGRRASYLTMISTTPTRDMAAPYVSAGPVYFGEIKDRFVREDGEWKSSSGADRSR